MDATKQKINVNTREYVFVERFRPKSVNDIILPETLKNDIKKWVEDGQIPNLLLTSKKPGLGKSSLAHTVINELKAEALFINASLESNIDTLRSKILGFVSTVSFDNRPKIVVLDEADYLNPNSTQPALRGFIEEFSLSARFILTANYKDKLIEPVRERLMDIDFDVIFKENKTLIKDIYVRCVAILEERNIEFDPEDLKYLVKHYYPSTRSIVMKLQQFSTSGKLTINKDALDSDGILDKIVNNILANEFEEMRKNITLISDPSILYTTFYDRLTEFPIEKKPPILLVIAKYQAHDAFVRDRVVNAAAMCAEIMGIIQK